MTDLASRIASLSPEKRALLEQRLGRGEPPSGADDAAIAVIGVGCRFPGGADSPEAFWRLLTHGVDAVREAPPGRWPSGMLERWIKDHPEGQGLRWGGFLDQVDQFDPQFFGLAPREAERMDPQQRLLLEVAWEALERAGQPAERLAGSRTGVFIGIHSQSHDYYWLQMAGAAGLDTHTSTGSAHSIMANRISYQFDLRGPSVSLDTACSSSLVAVHLACQSLLSGESELALAGGVNLLLAPESGMAFSLLQFMAPDGRCKTFDSRANGFVRGEGCGVVALRRLADARRDGDPVLAVIRGSAANQDGRSNGLTAPNGLAQQDVVRQACRRAGIDPASLGLVETHGTGTPLGDPIEVEALAAVIGPGRAAGRPCRLGAVKSNLGHLEAAAGVAGLIKAALCLRHCFIPPNLHLRELNPHLAPWATMFCFPTQGEAWETENGAPRRAGVSSFGFGGTNAHIVLEEAPAEVASATAAGDVEDGREEILILSAHSADALRAMAAAYAQWLDSPQSAGASLRDIACTAALRRTRFEHRLAVIGRSRSAWRAGLKACLQGEPGETGKCGEEFSVYRGEATAEAEAALERTQADPALRQALGQDRSARLRQLAELHVQGLAVDWAPFYAGGRCADLPPYPWQRTRCWLPAHGAIHLPAPEAPSPRGAEGEAAPKATPENLLYEVRWVERAPAEREPLAQVLEELAAPAAWSAQVEKASAYDRLGPRLDALALACARRAMRELGWTPALGEQSGADVLAARLGVDQSQRRLFARLLGWLAAEGGPDEDPEPLRQGLLRDFPAHAHEIELLARCGRRLGEALRGATPAVQILFPDGSAEALTRFYHESPLMRPWNRLAGEAAARALSHGAPGRPVRVLELGAGTGATTVGVLAALPAGGVEYWFTDVSRLFLGEGERRFAGRPGVRFGVLDLEADPEAQGFAPGSFDMIIAANVLHATADLRRSLARARALLRPGGRLALLEVTGRPRWIDLVFGLTEGWWKFRDADLRPDYPLLDRARWLEVLRGAGFAQAGALPPGDAALAGLFPQTLLLAETAESAEPDEHETAPAHGRWLILSDGLGFGEALAGCLRGRGACVAIAQLGPRFEPAGAQAWRISPDAPEDYARLLGEAPRALGGELTGVAWLWGLDAEEGGGKETEACARALLLARALASGVDEPSADAAEKPQSPRLFLVTRGAQAAGAAAAAPLALAQAPLWGLGRVLALERPELRCTLIDLDPAQMPNIAAARLAHELLAPDGEDQLALRGRRLAPRLAPWAGGPAAPPPFTVRRDGSYLVTGGLGGLGLKLARWLARRGAGQLVLTGRRGLPEGDPALAGKRRAVEEIEALGARVRVVAADVADEGRMRELFAQFGAALPPLRGIIHAAALIPWGGLAETSPSMLAEAFRAKAGGVRLLDRLTEKMELDFFVLFSSGATLWGSKGLAAYAAANQALDQLAHERRRRGLPALVVNWGWWAGGGTPRAAEEYYEQIGLLPLGDDEAFAALERALASGRAQAAAARIDWARFAPVFEARGRRPLLDLVRPARPAPPPEANLKNQESAAAARMLLALEPAARRAALDSIVREEVARTLGFADPAALEPRRGFFSLGMDSLLALQLHARLERRLGASLPSTLALERPTLQALTAFLEETLAPRAAPAKEDGNAQTKAEGAKRGNEKTANEELSEEDLLARLSEKLANLR